MTTEGLVTHRSCLAFNKADVIPIFFMQMNRILSAPDLLVQSVLLVIQLPNVRSGIPIAGRSC